MGGLSKKFTAVFKDSSGNILDLIPIWNINLPGGYENYFVTTIDNDNKIIKIKCLDNVNLLGTIITLNLSEGTNQYNATLPIKVVSLG